MRLTILASAMLAALVAPALAQDAAPAAAAGPWDPATRAAAQREAMKSLAFMDGEWRGPARFGEHPMTQTERVGPLLDGTVRLVEGRGYDGAGKTVFNAFAVISYDPVKRAYSMRSYAEGYTGDFPLTVRGDGWSWSQPMGPGATLKYTATFTRDGWRETGERVAGDATPVRMFEMNLKRVGDGAWPAGGAVNPR